MQCLNLAMTGSVGALASERRWSNLSRIPNYMLGLLGIVKHVGQFVFITRVIRPVSLIEVQKQRWKVADKTVHVRGCLFCLKIFSFLIMVCIIIIIIMVNLQCCDMTERTHLVCRTPYNYNDHTLYKLAYVRFSLNKHVCVYSKKEISMSGERKKTQLLGMKVLREGSECFWIRNWS